MNRKHILNSLLVASLSIYVGFGVILFVQQDSYIYYPEFAPGNLATCAKEDNAIAISDGSLQGVLYQKSTSSIIVVYHGNATNACEREMYALALHNHPANIFFVSYPGYLGTEETPSNASVLVQVDYVDAWIKKNNISVKGIIGESIGNGPASYHASIHPAPLALIAPYKRLSDVAQRIFWMYPTRFMIRYDFTVATWASKATSVLIIAGQNDAIIPDELGKDLFDTLPQQNKKYISFPDFDHADLLSHQEPSLEIAKFLTEK